MYIGWVKAGRAGAALVAIAFVAPSLFHGRRRGCRVADWRPGYGLRRI
jgi:hypothetical protein